MPLFVVLTDRADLDDDLKRRIAKQVKGELLTPHVPNDVFAVTELPRTLSGKTLEVPVKRILQGADPDTVVSRDSPRNRGALDWFVEFAASRAEVAGGSRSGS